MKLYNTLTKKIQAFKPIRKNEVRMYSCGPTVYHYAHIGNLRSFILSDILARALQYEGYKVKRVMNITDVGHLTGDSDAGEDKIEKEASKEKKTVWEVADFYTKAFLFDCERLNLQKPAKLVRATSVVPAQIKIIRDLCKKGYAYETEHAVYFEVAKFKQYGKLAGQSLADKLVAVRKEIKTDPEKRHPADFSLWFKRVGHFSDHAMHWQSPWGEGFPGWHIECSAIATKYLGQPFDIHTGGIDLIGTHHTNEIAQSEAAYGAKLANYWIHGEFLILKAGKMAKSTGNFLTLQSIIDKGFNPLAYRYLTLTAHYRSPLRFSWNNVQQAQNAYNNLVCLFAGASKSKVKDTISSSRFEKKFSAFVASDLNMPGAITALWDVAKSAKLSYKTKLLLVKKFDAVLGLDLLAAINSEKERVYAVPKEIHVLAEKRWNLKQEKLYDEADKIRLTLAKKGFIIDDHATGYAIKKT